MRLTYFALAALAVGVAGQGSFRTNDASTTTTATGTPAFTNAPPTTARTSTLFLATEPTLVRFGGDAPLSLKADVVLRADQRTFGFKSFSGVATNLKPEAFFPGIPAGLGGEIKPMSIDFALTTPAPASENKGPWDNTNHGCCDALTAECLACEAGLSLRAFCADPKNTDVAGCPATKLLHLGEPGSVDVLVSSEYFNAIFGYNFEERTDPTPTPTTKNTKHPDDHHHHDDHPVHEFDAASIPATLSFDKALVAAAVDCVQAPCDVAADGSEAALYLHGVVLTLHPRADHVKRGLKRDLVFELAPVIKIPTRTLSVPEGSLLPGKWLVSPELFPRWQWGRFELKRKLCVQPVRVAQRRCKWRLPFWLGGFCFWWTNTSVSGRGLAFGRDSANKHWGQVDITFDWQPWKTVIDRTGKYKALTAGQEETDLKNKVDDNDCIEVFFVESFSPASRMGGGACWGGGTAGAKIISSDENVDCGTDITHLAHELGHALNLKHPGSGSTTRPDGSTGTLLCPSGWEQDNPRRQSEENGDNASNPLLTSYLSFRGWWHTGSGSPDCVDSADCGSCNAHLPNEPCV